MHAIRMPMHEVCTPMHAVCMRMHTICMPIHANCMLMHAIRMPMHAVHVTPKQSDLAVHITSHSVARMSQTRLDFCQLSVFLRAVAVAVSEHGVWPRLCRSESRWQTSQRIST